MVFASDKIARRDINGFLGGPDPIASMHYATLGFVTDYVSSIGGGSGGTVVAVAPAGTIRMWAGTAASVPSGWLLCDGSAVSRTTYANLFTAISTTYGAGDGTNTFNLPNMQGRVPVGKAASGTFVTLGATGGEESHLLTAAESGLRSHRHSLRLGATAGTGSFDDYAVRGAGGAPDPAFRTGTPNAATSASGSNGYGSADLADANATATHNNLQPYLTVNYIISTGTQAGTVGGAQVVVAAAGTVRMWGGPTTPTGWLLCNGQAVSRTTYAQLFTVIGTTYGVGDGTSTFNVPQLAGKFPLGPYTGYTLGSSGGEAAHLLTAAESGLPSHNHTQDAHGHAFQADPTWPRIWGSSMTEQGLTTTTVSTGSAIAVASVSSGTSHAVLNASHYSAANATATNQANAAASASAAHNNMPPYTVVNFIISTGAATGTVSAPTTLAVTNTASVGMTLTGDPINGYGLSATTIASDTGWLTLAAGQYATNWSGYVAGVWAGVTYRLRNGVVYVTGAVQKSTTETAAEVMFTLPTGYRPTVAVSGMADNHSGRAITVVPSGAVSISAAGPGGAFSISLSYPL